MQDFTPARYAVFMHRKGQTSRVGNYNSEEYARAAIADSKLKRRDTLGGLLEPDNEPATYSIWKATWEQLT